MRWGTFDESVHALHGPSLVVDLRPLTHPGHVDESRVAPAGEFLKSVHGVPDGDTGLLVGEIICTVGGREIRIVGELTGRAALTEVTPAHLAAATHPAYRDQMTKWLFAG